MLGEVFNEFSDQVLWGILIYSTNRVRHVYNGIVLHYTQFEVVEEYQFHNSPFYT